MQHGDVSKLVAESIRSGTDDWEALVPHHVRDQIKALNLLGYRGSGGEEGDEPGGLARSASGRAGVTRSGSARGGGVTRSGSGRSAAPAA